MWRACFDDASQHIFSSVEEYYKKEHFEAIDIINGELERRFFSCKRIFYSLGKQKKLLDSANAKSANLPEKMEPIKFYHKDIDMNKLKIQLKMLTDAIKVTSMHGVPIKTNIMSSN